jgi:CheY-like chemotaxis protein
MLMTGTSETPREGGAAAPPETAGAGKAAVLRELQDLIAGAQRRLSGAGGAGAGGTEINDLSQALTRTAAAAERLLALYPSAAPAPPPPSRGMILAVEREPVLRQLYRAILSRAGYQMLLAESAEETLELYRAASLDVRLVILDTALPRWSVARVVRELRLIRTDVRVLLTSAADPVAAAADLPTPVAGLLAKPFQADQLLSLVDRLTDQPPAPTEP